MSEMCSQRIGRIVRFNDGRRMKTVGGATDSTRPNVHSKLSFDGTQRLANDDDLCSGRPHPLTDSRQVSACPSGLAFVPGEIWSGDGSLMFTGTATFSAVHELPIALTAVAFYSSAFNLQRPKETFPFEA